MELSTYSKDDAYLAMTSSISWKVALMPLVLGGYHRLLVLLTDLHPRPRSSSGARVKGCPWRTYLIDTCDDDDDDDEIERRG